MRWAHSTASASPLAVNLESDHPDHLLIRLHWLCPCRTMTNFKTLKCPMIFFTCIGNKYFPIHTRLHQQSNLRDFVQQKRNNILIHWQTLGTQTIVYNCTMIFDWSGLKNHRYFHLTSVNDPLKYCNYALPIPSPIGLPFMPCDLPNQYELSSTDQTYQQQGDIYLVFEQSVPLFMRILLPASHRPWQIVGKDYYNHVPYQGTRETNLCFSQEDRPTVQVRYQQRLVGKVVERSILNCCCWTQNYQELQIYDKNNRLIYRVISKNPQRGHKIILPCWGFERITYDILKIGVEETTNAAFEEGSELIRGERVGEIVHLFHGLNQYTSKNDKYGITFPADSSEEQKCLLIYCTLLIDYLLFCNF